MMGNKANWVIPQWSPLLRAILMYPLSPYSSPQLRHRQTVVLRLRADQFEGSHVLPTCSSPASSPGPPPRRSPPTARRGSRSGCIWGSCTHLRNPMTPPAPPDKSSQEQTSSKMKRRSWPPLPTSLVEAKLVLAGVDGDGDGPESGHGLLQQVLVPPRHKGVGGAFRRPKPAVVLAQAVLRRGAAQTTSRV